MRTSRPSTPIATTVPSSARAPRRGARIVVLLAIAASLLGAPTLSGPARADDIADRIAAARARQTDLRASVARQDQILGGLQRDAAQARDALTATGHQLDGIGDDLVALRKDIATATAALARVRARRDSLQHELGQLDRTLDLLEQEIAQGAADLADRRRALGQRLADAYREQHTSLLEQVIDSGSFSDVVSDTSAYLAYSDQDAQMATQIAQDQADLDSLRAVNAATRYRTDQLRRAAQDAAVDLRAQKQKLATAKAKALALERKVKAKQREQLRRAHQIAANQQQARAIAQEHAQAQKQLDRRIAGLVRAAERRAAREQRARAAAAAAAARRHATQQRIASVPQGNGRLEWPAAGYVTQEYGCTGFYLEPRRGSCAHFHDGIDIAGATGTLIHAADDGVVAFVGWNPYDNDPAYVVVIGHSGGFSTTYAHLLPRRVVHAGQSVRRGQVIGYMGSTGNSTGSHLHWEVRRNGRTVNGRLYS